MDVWSRFWPAITIGPRSYENTKQVIRATSLIMDPQGVALIVTDGYNFYERAIRKCFEKCLYAQIIKTRSFDTMLQWPTTLFISISNLR